MTIIIKPLIKVGYRILLINQTMVFWVGEQSQFHSIMILSMGGDRDFVSTNL